MAYTTIDDPSAYFHTQLYTGDGASSHSITNDANAGDFSPDWLWVKNRTSSGGASENIVFDTTRGSSKDVLTNKNEAEHTETNVLLSFDTNGFSVGTGGAVNENSSNFVAWQWKANGGTTSSNADGSITSTVQANTTAGFSIVTYTGTATGGATIGHGLGVAPKVVFTKTRAIADNWLVYHEGIGATKYLTLNTTSASGTSTGAWNDTAPSSTVVTLGSFDNSNDNDSMVAYCFAEKQGYSKFGSYTGNGSTDGPFVYLGFKPAWVMVKRTNTTGAWEIYDSARNGNDSNPINDRLRANENLAENTDDTTDYVSDFLSNGWKIRTNSGNWNTSGHTYIYMAFAENPFVSSEGVPTTAR